MKIAGKKIQELKKKELVRIVELLLEKNPANITYLEHHFLSTKPDRRAFLSRIEKATKETMRKSMTPTDASKRPLPTKRTSWSFPSKRPNISWKRSTCT